MADKIMWIPKNGTKKSPSVNYNYNFKRLHTQLNEPTNQNSIKVLKVVRPTNKKSLLYNFGD